jgi:hypothetical protein
VNQEQESDVGQTRVRDQGIAAEERSPEKPEQQGCEPVVHPDSEEQRQEHTGPEHAVHEDGTIRDQEQVREQT